MNRLTNFIVVTTILQYMYVLNHDTRTPEIYIYVYLSQ